MSAPRHRWLSALVVVYGLLLTCAGAMLLSAGGTPYFAFAGLGTVLSGVWNWRGSRAGLAVYAVVLMATLVWAVGEAGWAFWLLGPRLAAPAVVGLLLLAPWLQWRAVLPKAAVVAGGIGAVALLAGGAMWLRSAADGGAGVPSFAPAAETQWRSFANGNDGRRFAEAGQITPDNVAGLEVAWIYRSGEDPAKLGNPRNLPVFEATPLKVGPTLYLCTPRNRVIAIDAQTGVERWSYDPHTDTSGSSYLLACRGVSYAQTPQSSVCPQRIIAATGDGRLLALHALTGIPCADFGGTGQRSLRRNLGKVESGFYGVTSAPLVANGVIVTGSMVLDNQAVDVPSGVIRGFDVVTARQLWAFDTGAETPTTRGEPSQDHIYTRGSPNAWAPFSADEALGLVFVPTGNASPDYFGAQRSPAMERHASSLLALDLRSGELRWAFQTVHHDVWDFDVSAQPILAEWGGAHGAVPAVIQATKRGDIFVLDRRTGKPLAAVEERPVPQGVVKEERLAATQPMSTGIPFLGPKPRTEAAMWGVTPFDQIWCRYTYRKLRYDGPFTPPTVQGTLQSPNQTGASSWGRLSLDPVRGLLIANTINLDSIVKLIPRGEADRLRAAGKPAGFPQSGTPYGVSNTQFVSPLGLPCNAPPWGELRAIDLKTGSTAWQQPFGTTANRLPLHIELPLGLPSVGGPLTTKTGLTFIGAADDGYFRAYETRTGKLLRQFALPAGGQAAPMTYVSAQGRQYVVIAAGGDRRMGTRLGDYVMAFALPEIAGQGRAAR